MTLAQGNITRPIWTPVSSLLYKCIEYKVFFEWDAIDDARYYDLQIATNNSFVDPIIDWDVYATKVTINLGANVYYVRMRGVDKDDNTGDWSDTLTITVYTKEDASIINSNATYTKKIVLEQINEGLWVNAENWSKRH